MNNSLLDAYNKLFNQNVVEYKTLSKTSQMLSDNINTSTIQINDAKKELYLLHAQLIANLYKAFLVCTNNAYKVLGIVSVLIIVLGLAIWGAYQILSTIYTDIAQLFSFSVYYTVADENSYTLPALFGIFSLYVWISIFGIKAFFSKIFNKVSDKVNDKKLDSNNQKNN